MNFGDKTLRALLIVTLSLIGLAPASAQFIQQARLAGTGVALSADGNTAILQTGATYAVYIRNNDVWTEQGVLGEGYPAALSGDGNTAMVGSFVEGKVRVFVRSNGVWSQQGPDLLNPGDSYENFGYSISLSGDGNTAIVGAPVWEGGGGAWVFVRRGAVWSQQGPRLFVPDVLYGGDALYGGRQGYAVALSADGNTAIMGGPTTGETLDSPIGAAWIFVRRNGVWTRQGKKLVGTGGYPDPGFGQRQGSSVALSADGSTALVGGPFDIAGPWGAAWVFSRNNNVGEWRQQGPKLYDRDTDAPGYEGISVSLSADGNTAVLGGPCCQGYEGAVVFTRRDGLWAQQGSKILGTTAAGGHAGQGTFVALSADAKTLLVGGSGEEAAWVFVSAVDSGGPVPGWSRVPIPVGVPGGVTRDGSDRNLQAVAFGTFQVNGSAFAAGGLGGNIVIYDGIKPTNRPVAPVSFQGVAFSDTGAGIAVADNGWIFRSTDGVQWIGQHINNNNFIGVAYANSGIFVAVQTGGRIFRSTDSGLTWQESLNSGQPWTTHDLTGVAFGYWNATGAFVIVAKGGQTLYSTNYGVTWQTVDLLQVVSEIGPYYTPVWNTMPLAPALNLQSVAFGHGEFVAVADTGAVFSSRDFGQSWAWTFVGPAANARPLYAVAYGAGSGQEYFVAVGKDGVTLIGEVDPLTADITWTPATFPTVLLHGVSFGLGRFVAVGYGATILQTRPLPWVDGAP